jgi:hypothetical protein
MYGADFVLLRILRTELFLKKFQLEGEKVHYQLRDRDAYSYKEQS